jgi:hypothetical protein
MAQARGFWEIEAWAYPNFILRCDIDRSPDGGGRRGPAVILVSVHIPGPTQAYRRAMEAAYTLDDARVLFPDLVEEARVTRRPVLVADDGEPVVAIIDVQWLEDCERLMAERHPA